MSTGQKARRSRRVSIVPLMTLLAAAIALGIAVTSLVPGLILRAQQQKELAQVERELVVTQQENSSLKDEVERLSDPEYLEVIARSRYNLAKPGERLYNVIDVPDATPDATPAPGSTMAHTKPSWWRNAVDSLSGG